MKKISSKQAKDHFGELIDSAQREPVEIQKKGRSVAVLVSLEEYQRLGTLEDAWWAKQAHEAAKEGFLGSDDSEKLLRSILNVKD